MTRPQWAARIKEKLELNIELASPDQFIPEIPGWQDRSAFIAREGRLSFYHYDFYAQALSKIERAHARDVLDVREMSARRLIAAHRLLEFFASIEPELYRYPAIDPRSFRAAVERTAAELLEMLEEAHRRVVGPDGQASR